MHLGLRYPFAYQYWATECQFFPGYVPWKYTVKMTDAAAQFLGAQAAPTIWAVTQEMVLDTADATQVSWKLRWVTESDFPYLILSEELEQFHDGRYAVYKLRVFNMFDLMTGFCYYFRAYPCYQANCDQAWNLHHDPDITPTLTGIDFEPAGWSQAGQVPWK